MQNCTPAAHRKFQKNSKKLVGTWVIRLNRHPARDELCEVVAVHRGTVLLMQVWREARPAYILEKPPYTLEASLRGFLDPNSGFSYLGPRYKFDWIVPNVMMRHRGRSRPPSAQVTSLTGPRVLVSFVPSMYRERVRRYFSALPPGPHAERFPTVRDMWIWEVAKNYERARGVSPRDWREVFAREHSEIELEDQPPSEPTVGLLGTPSEPELESPRGLSVWERITIPTTDEDE